MTAEPDGWHRHLTAVKKKALVCHGPQDGRAANLSCDTASSAQEAALETKQEAVTTADAAHEQGVKRMSRTHEKLVLCQAEAEQLSKQRRDAFEEYAQLQAMYTSLLGEPLQAAGQQESKSAGLLAAAAVAAIVEPEAVHADQQKGAAAHASG